MEIFLFFVWTLMLYIIHRLMHIMPILRNIHLDHHIYIIKNIGKTGWKWNNLFLYNDTWLSTLDLWITEVIPTIVFAYITGHWWILVLYYIWAAFIQEQIEHNHNIDYYPFTSGKWHLNHHKNYDKNYGLFHPLWDRLFRTELL